MDSLLDKYCPNPVPNVYLCSFSKNTPLPENFILSLPPPPTSTTFLHSCVIEITYESFSRVVKRFFRKSSVSLRLFNEITWNLAHQDTLWNITSLHQNLCQVNLLFLMPWFSKIMQMPYCRFILFACHIRLNISRMMWQMTIPNNFCFIGTLKVITYSC